MSKPAIPVSAFLRLPHGGLAIATVLLVAQLLVPANAVQAYTASNYTEVGWSNGATWNNYDNLDYNMTSTTADWPIGLIFSDNADRDRVKSSLGVFYPNGGSEKHEGLCSSSPYGCRAVDDSGKKNSPGGCPGENVHFRVYAPSDGDHLYHPYFGYFVVGSAHIDHNEGCAGTWFGMSEDAEADVASKSQTIGWGVLQDVENMYNAEPHRVEGPHRWQNDGMATEIQVPVATVPC